MHMNQLMLNQHVPTPYARIYKKIDRSTKIFEEKTNENSQYTRMYFTSKVNYIEASV